MRTIALALLLAAVAVLPVSVFAQTGGPDAYGYTYGPTTYAYQSIAATGTATGATDESYTVVTLPWAFPFYGVSYSYLYISSNGAVRFASTSSAAAAVGYTVTCLPASATLETPDIAVFWDDFDPGAGGEVYYRNDTSNGRFVVSWEGIPIYLQNAYGTVTFQLHLYPNGTMTMHYSDVYFGASSSHNYGALAATGIEDRVAGIPSIYYLQRSCVTPPLSATTAVIWSPPCSDADGDGYTPTTCGGLDCDDLVSSVHPGTPEICDGYDTDCSGSMLPGGESDADADGWRLCEGDCDDGNDLAYPGLAEACDGFDTDCDGLVDFDSQGETDDDGDGWLTCTGDCDDNAGNIYPNAQELCDGLDQDCAGPEVWEIAVTDWTGSFTASDFFRGNILRPNDDVVLDEVQGFFSSSVAQNVTFVVYESLNSGSTYTAIATRVVPVPAGVPDWWTTASWGVSLVAGRTYAIGAWWPETLTYRVQSDLSMPYVASWANHNAGAILEGYLSVPSSTGSLTASSAYGFRYRVQGEADGDLDGYLVCQDCDDTTAPVHPGALEICDGVDTNCDGILPAAEANADGDPQAVCQGDCADANSTVWNGAPELCDGLDNDCNGLIPIEETGDPDGDSVFGCTDCDNNDPNAFPGSPEICDGVDNDCDGFVLPGGTWGLSSGGTPAVATGRFRGNVWHVTSTAVLTTIEANLTIPLGSTLSWLVYRASSMGGSYVLVSQATSTATSGTAEWHASPSFDLPLETGWYYGVGVHFSAAATHNSVTSPGFPVTQPFGSLVGGATYTSATVLGNSSLSTPTGYLIRFSTQEEVDNDGDGVASCLDCDDDDALRFPGSLELCDGVDSDCDGLIGPTELDGDSDGITICGGDCNDAAPQTWPGAPEACDGADNNCDGASLAPEADGDADGVRVCAADCNDANPALFPGNPELCNGSDEDCDGLADADLAGETDADADGQRTCAGDCDDSSPARYTGAAELCNGTDDDCDGLADADLAGEVDVDGDGSRSCQDCDDNSAAAFPGNVESCNGLDDDCVGGPDFGGGELDSDGDGYRACAECNDASANAHPGGVEVCDSLDNDCDPTTSELGDEDNDDLSLCDGDCDDTNPAVNPLAEEVCNGIDDDCESATDEDGDGDADGSSLCEGDCVDGDATIHLGATEVCDAADTDCDGIVPPDEQDSDDDGWALCQDDRDDDDDTIHPDAVELCNGVDDNCNGSIADESADEDGDGSTPCDGDCDDLSAEIHPGAEEICNGRDDDCDEEVPGDELDGDGDGLSACEGDCLDEDPTVNPSGLEDSDLLCADDLDNDCDGATDANDTECGGTGEGDDDDDSTAGDTDARGCACGTHGGGQAGWLVLLGLAVMRRRQR